MEIQVVHFNPNTGEASIYLDDSPKTLQGMDKLVQIVVLEFLRNPGQDVILPMEGSGLRAELGQFNFADSSEVKLLIVQRTQLVEQRVLQNQEVGVTSPTERLKALKILNIGLDPDTAQALLRVQIINEAGDTTDVLV
jgi:hypothetical protein